MNPLTHQASTPHLPTIGNAAEEAEYEEHQVKYESRKLKNELAQTVDKLYSETQLLLEGVQQELALIKKMSNTIAEAKKTTG